MSKLRPSIHARYRFLDRLRKRVLLALVGVLASSLVLGSLAPAFARIMTVETLDVARYLGTWHEVARFPVFYQLGCSDSTAIYKQVDEVNYSVTNTCKHGSRTVEINGDAVVSGVGKFKVKFSSFFTFRAEYWVMWVSPNYQLAVVGVPKGNRGWILARSQNPSPQLLNKALLILEKNGYDVSDLIWNDDNLKP
ncbi:MAG: lipocalin family protein [Pseudomonadota bacterium]